jgi:hypothetical protein
MALSLVVVARDVGWRPSGWAIAPMIALLMLWVPLWLHTLQGQLGLLLLAIFTGAWWAGRRGWWGWCGALLGLAATIKVFPILLLGLLALLRHWRGLIVGLIVAAAVTLVTTAVLGVRAMVDYVTIVLPNLDRWRPDWINSSFTGFFAHLFAPDATTAPLLASPALAVGASALASLLVVGLVGRVALRHGNTDFDGVFALALTGLLLLSALTWSHYFVVLLLPLVIWLPRLTQQGRPATGRWLTLVFTWLLMAVPQLDVALAVVGDGVAEPWHAVTVLALNFYGLLGFFLAQAWWLRTSAAPRDAQPAVERRHADLVASGERVG